MQAAAAFPNQRLGGSVSPVRQVPVVSKAPIPAAWISVQQVPAFGVAQTPQRLPSSPLVRSCGVAAGTAPPVVVHQAVQPLVVCSAAPRMVSSVRPQLLAAERLAQTLREQAAKQLVTCLKSAMLRQVTSSLARWWRAAEEDCLGEHGAASMLSKLAVYDRVASGHDRVSSVLSTAMTTEGQRAAYHSRTLSVLLGLRRLHTFMQRRGRKNLHAAFQQLATHRPALRLMSVSFDELAAKNGLRKSVLVGAKERESWRKTTELSNGYCRNSRG